MRRDLMKPKPRPKRAMPPDLGGFRPALPMRDGLDSLVCPNNSERDDATGLMEKVR
jgi:hypothetical protein